MPPLRATYRLQFHRGFGLADARVLADYFERLGISHLYASPLLQARHGSRHGYDVTDPTRLNAEIGTAAQLAALARALRRRRMGLLLDIVPNHMAASVQNPWWRDVLARGEHSRYAQWFDIDWKAPMPRRGGKVLLPIVGGSFSGASQRHEFTLAFNDDEGWVFRYKDQDFPLALHSNAQIVEAAADELEALARSGDKACRRILALAARIRSAGPHADADTALARQLHAAMREAADQSPAFGRWVKVCLRHWNRSPTRLEALLRDQHYHWADWREANRIINYRRFFAINDLVSFREELPEAFAARHALVAAWLRKGWVDALRVDHIDGLADPLEYLRRLQTLFTRGSGPVVVEKILARGERLPANWPVLGATGYEFLFYLDRLQTPAPGAAAVVRFYRRFIRRAVRFADVAYGKKRQVIRSLFIGEIAALGRRLHRLAVAAGAPALDAEAATRTLSAIASAYAVYRTYARRLRLTAAERREVWAAVARAALRETGLSRPALDWTGRLLSCDARARVPAPERREWLAFVRRWQQYTAPIMAKGLEDSALYVYVPLPALCEVGGDPDHVGLDAKTFHQAMQRRLRRHPAALNATSTHDTKRSEDVRARLNVLTEMPDELRRRLSRWARWNAPHRSAVERRPVPDRNLEYLYYHSLLGAWPLECLRDSPGEDFRRRLSDYIVKAAREAKVETTWERPNADFEAALTAFVADTLDESRAPVFLHDLRGLIRRIAPAGALNSLVQVALKILSPGVPDLYQGCELWNFSLVDPDNRRPVDFDLRRRLLRQMESDEPPAERMRERRRYLRELLHAWTDGRVKLWLTRHLLRLRAARATVFQTGQYLPVRITGRHARHLLAFVRQQGREAILGAFPLSMSDAVSDAAPEVSGFDWADTRLVAPQPARYWRDTATGAVHHPDRDGVLATDLFGDFPIAVLEAQ